MPKDYHLQAYDDCGVADRQPHIHCDSTYLFPAFQVDADERSRTVAVGNKQVEAVYDHLAANLDCVLAVTYTSERGNKRVQSLWADGVQLHGPHTLADGKAERLLLRIPREAIRNGRLSLQFKLESGHNAVVSLVELWAAAPSPKVLHLYDINAFQTDLTGKVINLSYDMPVPDVTVELHRKPHVTAPLATFEPDPRRISFPSGLVGWTGAQRRPGDRRHQRRTTPSTHTRKKADLYFAPIRFRPVPTQVHGLGRHQMSLDGVWRVNSRATEKVRDTPLVGPGLG